MLKQESLFDLDKTGEAITEAFLEIMQLPNGYSERGSSPHSLHNKCLSGKIHDVVIALKQRLRVYIKRAPCR